MKKFLTVLLLFITQVAFGQSRQIIEISVADTGATFNRNILAGTKIYNQETGLEYITLVGLPGTAKLGSIPENVFKLETVDLRPIQDTIQSVKSLMINYLPLAGGKLLGPLLGTSGKFSGAFSVGKLSVNDTSQPTSGVAYFNGNVGFSTKSPVEKADINGAIRLSNSAPNNNSVGGYALWNTGGTLYWNGYPLSNGVGAAITGSGSVGIITKWTSPTGIGQSIIIDSTSLIHITGGLHISGSGGLLGNFGIGTYSPTEAADIHGAIHLTSTTPNNSAPGGNVLWNNGGVLYWNGYTLSTGASSSLTGSGTTNNITKWTTAGTIGQSIMTDDGTAVTINGNAIAPQFVSTTTTLSPFSVSSNHLVANLNAQYLNGHPATDFVTSAVPYSLATSNVDLNAKFLGNVGKLSVGSATLPSSGVAYFNGNAGFGTDAPTENVDVNGAIHLRSATPNNGDYTLWNNGGTLYWNGAVLSTGTGSAITGSGSANSLTKWTTSNTIGNSIITDNGSAVTVNGDLLTTGKIGINVQTPSEALDIGGKIALDGVAIAYRPTDFTGTIFFGDGGNNLSHTTGYQGYYNTYVGLNSGNSNTSGYKNTAVGYQSLNYTSSGIDNTALGNQALFYNNSGNDNVGVGNQALYSNTNGTYNFAGGSYSLFSNTGGSDNTASGYYSLYSNIAGHDNTASGYYSLYSNTYGLANTAIGAEALFSNTTADSNVAVGYQAGRYVGSSGTAGNVTGKNSVFIGANTRAAGDGQTNQIVIGANAVGNGSNSAVLGNSGIEKTTLYGNVGFGTKAPAEKADIRGAVRLADTMPQNAAAGGYALWNQGGVLYWNGSALATGGGGTSGIAGSGNPGVIPMFIRSDSLGESPIAKVDSSINISAPINIRNKPAIYVYPNALGSLTVGGPVSSTLDNSWATYNTFVGYLSGGNVTTGSSNVSIGAKALRYLTNGGANTAVGGGALQSATGATYNVALGYYSLYSLTYGTNNIGLGPSALYGATNCDNNISIGQMSLYSVSTGSNNIAIGFNAGRYYNPSGNFSLTTPQNCIYIGNNTRSFANSQTDEIVIGNNAFGHGSHTITLGDTLNTDIFLNGSIHVATIDTLIIQRAAPASSIGSAGDIAGMVAADNTYFFYCTATYDGTTNIWKRIAWSADTW